MEKTNWWIAGGLTLTALGIGIGSYLLFFRNKQKTDSNLYGNQKSKDNRSNNTDLGMQTTKGEQATRVSIPDWNNPYDMVYTQDVKTWVSPQRIYELNPMDAEGLAKQLKEAYGGAWYANDDEEAVKMIFTKILKDKVQVSGLSKAFWRKYQKDMWEYLANFLSSTELEEYVHKPVKELANYRIIK